jgi:hypothetical protein
LYELSLAGKDASGWNVGFSWPADVGGQIVVGSGVHQKRWGALPSGFYPPYLSLSSNVTNTIKQFRFDWVLGKPGTRSGAAYVGSTAFISPIKVEGADPVELAAHAREAGVALVDGTVFENPNREIEFLTALSTMSARTQPATVWLTAREWVAAIDDADLLPSSSQIYERDYSKWVLSERQRLAWVALADAREVIEDYQNSGRANLKRLDAALEEMYSAEGGEFLFALGQNKFISVVSERSFLATVANVYRLCGVQIPNGLSSWFTNARWKKTEPSAGSGEQGPFYVDGTDSMTWNDPVADEGGERKLIYPVGKYPPGAFDLRGVRVSWDDSDVKFSVILGAMADPGANLVLPLVDIYVDVNKLSGAGAQDVIPGRRGGSISREAAWEYALALSPMGAVLYQGVPGGAPRTVQPTSVVVDGNQLTVSLPRTALRGNPKQWQLTVTLSGTESRKIGDFTPVAVQQNANDHAFGGGADRPSASFVDLLAETPAEQKVLLSGSGSDRFALPSVEAQ